MLQKLFFVVVVVVVVVVVINVIYVLNRKHGITMKQLNIC